MRICRSAQRVFSILTVGLFAFTLFFSVAAEPEDSKKDDAVSQGTVVPGEARPALDYSEYISHYLDKPLAREAVRCPGGRFTHTDSDVQKLSSYLDKADVLKWESGKGVVEYTVDVPAGALYSIRLSYLLPEKSAELRMGIRIDGGYPFSGLESVVFQPMWTNDSEEARYDGQGNQLTPEQVEWDKFVTQPVRDHTGVEVDAYSIFLTAGPHVIALVSPGAGFYLEAIELAAPENPQDYASAAAGYSLSAPDHTVEPIRIQGEDARLKSKNSLIPRADNGDAGVYPASPYLTLLNYIGGTSWGNPGETLTWDFQVEESGYYKLGFSFKQSYVVNGESCRWIKIDGKTPFKEAKEIRFPYKSTWQFQPFADGNGEPYYIWLEKGPHQVSMEVTLGAEISGYYKRLSRIVNSLGDEYMKIVKITGESPDINRDYNLFQQIPGFNDTLQENYDGLMQLIKDMQSFTGKRSTQYIAALRNMARVLESMKDKPYMAHQYVKNYYSNYCTVSSWLYEMKSMPLAIDEIQWIPYGQEYPHKRAGFADSFLFGIKRFFSSFSQDYKSLSAGGESDKALTLWVNWGRDQAMVLNSLIQDSFTASTSISVRVEMVNASLVKGILSGNYPDVALHMARTEPVNLGMRGALYDLSQFDDFEEVLSRYQDGAETPYLYRGGCYAIPDTQTFHCMFYRKDVLSSLGLPVPKTWDEFLYASATIQRNNMQIYIPYTQITTATTVDAGVGSLHLFPTLMLQNHLSLYNEEKTATTLSAPQTMTVFEKWIDLYTDYLFVKEADFYNRFRVGSMPLGIAPYTTYMTLSEAAPEIQGRWSIAPIPGVTGTENQVAGGGTGCSIVKKSSHIPEAWEFLKWWTSEDTQTRYSRNVESILGLVGRQATANVEAFKNFTWDSESREQLLTQWGRVVEIPEIPGSYILTRSIDQAFWQVINGRANEKDALLKWSQSADNEISRKIQEYADK